MDGTHKPIKMAASFSPLNQSVSEKTKERIADSSNSLSVVVNFLNIKVDWRFEYCLLKGSILYQNSLAGKRCHCNVSLTKKFLKLCG